MAQAQEIVLTEAAEAQVDALAFRVAASFKPPKGFESSPAVLVFDFTQAPSGKSSLLGTLLADKFSERLAAIGGVEVIDRHLLGNYLKENWTKIEDVTSYGLYFGIAKEVGATDFVRATLIEDTDRRLKISLKGGGARSSFNDEAKFLISKELENLLAEPVPPSFAEPTEVQNIPPEPGVLVFGPQRIEGLIGPRCISCPDARYTEVARAAKLQGTVKLSVVVTTAGEITSIYVLKGAPGGLTQRAIETVKTWGLQPATKDGEPAAVRVPLEITFRLLTVN